MPRYVCDEGIDVFAEEVWDFVSGYDFKKTEYQVHMINNLVELGILDKPIDKVLKYPISFTQILKQW